MAKFGLKQKYVLYLSGVAQSTTSQTVKGFNELGSYSRTLEQGVKTYTNETRWVISKESIGICRHFTSSELGNKLAEVYFSINTYYNIFLPTCAYVFIYKLIL